MQIFYFDNSTKEFTYTDLIDDGQAIPNNATKIRPVDSEGKGLLDPVWNGTAWVGLSEEAFVEKHKLNDMTGGYIVPNNKPSSDDQTISVLTAQLLQAQMTVKQQGTQIASLTGALLANAKAKATN
jgi:hypothetical protein